MEFKDTLACASNQCGCAVVSLILEGTLGCQWLAWGPQWTVFPFLSLGN